ncbi:hypothetical protein B0T22DRAFT_180108 [Podospora appendiculata]|uniref:DUF676 domain-containing protein n=1 Tax=Podospora appendiculata TaxID=314037 RepID=A0AAE1CDP0_9PEZI|nr:hypothetical protein B0T22DRAFT_180108 [Podospora appendiculata]
MSPSLIVVSIITMAVGLASITGLRARSRRRAEAQTPDSSQTIFFGSQVGGKSVINYSYTDLPWKLMAYDIYYFLTFSWALPHIVLPLTPSDSGPLAELSFTAKNIFCIVIHIVLCILQLSFLVSLPVMLLLPVWTAAILIGLFFLVNYGLCELLNGKDVEYHSEPHYAEASPEHAHEQWVFINGVAAGEHWMQSNLNRLALTFKRPILGIHNKTNGIIFDVIECLIQRNLGVATTDVRVCYRIIKEKLYNPQYTKVIFILHSQGAIEGSLIMDWLLQELPQDLLSKLEVYTFGNAANHFNNPHRRIHSQKRAENNPLAAQTDTTNAATVDSSASVTQQGLSENRAMVNPLTTLANSSDLTNGNTDVPRTRTPPPSPPPLDTTHVPPTGTQASDFSLVPALTHETSSLSPSAVSGRAIGHIEHYAHTTDFVALWGVLHFATSVPLTRSLPRFIGRVFARTSSRGGHQFCQHYLDGMFPLARDAQTGAFIGCADVNEFMESEIVLGVEGDEMENAREAREVSSWLGNGHGNADDEPVEIHGDSPVERRGRARRRDGPPATPLTKAKVKELSRLWQYRNGRCPEGAKRGHGADGSGTMMTM